MNKSLIEKMKALRQYFVTCCKKMRVTSDEVWECDNTHELYDIEEIYAKYVQHTQAGRV